MHILVVYLYYLRPGDAGIKRWNEFCQLFAREHGLKVSVLTGMVNHYLGQQYPDVKGRRLAVEQDGDVTVYRVGHPDTYAQGFRGRAYTQLRWAYNCRRALTQLPERPDIVIASSPPLWAGVPMFAAKRLGLPVILEVRDIWPESIVQAGLAKPWHPVVRYLASLERAACRAADHIVTLVPTMNRSIAARRLKAPEQITTITNGIVLEDFDGVGQNGREKMRHSLGVDPGTKLAIYSGQHGKMQDVLEIVKLAEALKYRTDIRLVTIGDGPEREGLVLETRRRGLSNLQFLGSVPGADVPKYLKAADIALSFINTRPGTNWDNETRGVFRNAFFDAAGARLPLVFNIPGFPVEEIQNRAKAGLFASTVDGPEALASQVIYLADHPAEAKAMGENNYREIAVRYNRRGMAAAYVELMRGLVEKRRGSSSP